MKRTLAIICFMFYSAYSLLFADNDLTRGLDAYSRFHWDQAIMSFENALISLPSQQREVLYWLVMAQASAQNYRLALHYAELFLQRYPSEERAAEVLYQKGRILHLCGAYKASSQDLYRFIAVYPDHPKVPSAYYWIGETLYENGAYSEARTIFAGIILDYPQSGKVNEARQKIMFIDHLTGQNERQQVPEVQPALADSEVQEVSSEELPKTVAEPVPEEGKSEAPAVAELPPEDKRLDELKQRLDDEHKENEELYNKIAGLEEKIDALSALLARMAGEQEARFTQEQQEKEREHAVQMELAERQKELKDLQQRARTLEKIYEQRMKGAK